MSQLESAPEFSIDTRHVEFVLDTLDEPVIESLRSLQDLGTLFESAEAQAVSICLSDSMFIRPDIDREKAERVLRNVDYTGIDPLTREYWDILAVQMTKEYVARKIIREVIDGPNSAGLSATEKTTLLGSLDIADHTDRLYWEWRENVVTSSLSQRLAAMGAKDATSYLQKQGALPDAADEYMYAVFTEPAVGKVRTLSYAEAFPEAMAEIAQAIERMVLELHELSEPSDKTERDALIIYYNALRRALTSKNISAHEALYADVDRAWLQVHGRMQPIHLMESYDDFLGLRVEPDYVLTFRDERYQDVNDLVEVAKKLLIEYLSDEYGNYASLQASVNPMASSIAGVFTTVAASGRRMAFKAGGQNIPNREIIRQTDGVKIFIDMKAMQDRWETEKTYLIRLLGEDVVEAEFANEEEIIKIIAGFFVGGHEVGHNAFIQPGTKDALGSATYKSIEENKADQSIVVSVADVLNLEQKQVFLKGFLASLLRDLTLRNDPAKRPYYNGGLVSFRIMQETGMLTKGTNGGFWNFDLSKEKISGFFDLSKKVYRELVTAYEHLSSEEAKKYAEKYYYDTPFIESLLRQVGLTDTA